MHKTVWSMFYQNLTTAFLYLAGGVMTGPLTLAADPTVALGAATKQYVDALQARVAALEAALAAVATGPSYANDAAAATGGVAVHHEYRNGSILMVRVT